jgi:hypothetical protein
MTVLINVVFLVRKEIGYSHEACSFANANKYPFFVKDFPNCQRFNYFLNFALKMIER